MMSPFFRKLSALICKDTLLLVRDKAGLCMMFLMPMLLVVIMTKLQDSTFNSINETHIPLIFLNNDADSLGMTIERQISSSAIFDVTKASPADSSAREKLIAAVARGEYMTGIIIPKNATKTIRDNVHLYVSAAFSGNASEQAANPVQIEIYIDPVTKSSFRNALMSALREQSARTESSFLSQAIVAEVNRYFPVAIPDINITDGFVNFSEKYALSKEDAAIPNSTQHNIPAWSMFAVFFIAISLSGNIIKEREDGSYTRLLTMPCPYHLYTFAKATVYMCVCMLQYSAIFLMGVYLFPALGLPSFSIGVNIFPAIVMGISSAAAAIGYGIAIGRVAGTHQQAAIFASVSTVIMAAIGGIWIPVFVMPSFMKYASMISPLNWGLEGFYKILIRNGDIFSILPQCAASIIFAILCITLSPFVGRKRKGRI